MVFFFSVVLQQNITETAQHDELYDKFLTCRYLGRLLRNTIKGIKTRGVMNKSLHVRSKQKDLITFINDIH